MALKFHDILPGEGVRCSKKDGDAAVDGAVPCICERGEVGVSRFELEPRQLLTYRLRPWP